MLQTYSEIFSKLQLLVADVTGDDPAYITPDMALDQLTLEDMAELIKKINVTYKIALIGKRVLEDTETMGELADLIEVEVVLG